MNLVVCIKLLLSNSMRLKGSSTLIEKTSRVKDVLLTLQFEYHLSLDDN